jgi:hypothetical protein
MSDGKPEATRHDRWFWGNLIACLFLAPFATYWFQTHVQLYFSEIVVVGGVFTLWAVLRLVWGICEGATEVKAWDLSRRLLSSSGTTRLIIVGAVLLLVLWRTTSSIYLEFHGAKAGENEYVIHVVNKADGRPYLDPVTISSAHPLTGRPVLWSRPRDLECRIVAPIGYLPAACPLRPGTSTRIRIPDDFPEKEYHLVRLVPGKKLYKELPKETDEPVVHYDLELTAGTKKILLKDLRLQTVYVGAEDAEMGLVRSMENQVAYQQFLMTRFRATGLDPNAVERMAAVLSTTTRDWPGTYLKSGDRVTVRIIQRELPTDGKEPTEALTDFTTTYTVTGDKVQTIWIPAP